MEKLFRQVVYISIAVYFSLTACDNKQCSSLISNSTAAEINSTPRDDGNIELLALSMSDGVIADQAIYDRLIFDVPEIREKFSEVKDISYFPKHDGKGILIKLEDEAFKAVKEGSFTEWDCLNDHYGNKNISIIADSISAVLVELKGIYKTELIADEYQSLAGVIHASDNSTVGDGSTICVTPEDEIYHYVFEEASGDCPRGCTEHIYYYFTTSPNESPLLVDSWKFQESIDIPVWANKYGSCSGYPLS